MSDAPLRLPSIARQLKGEEHRLTQLLIQLGGSSNAHPEVWRALVERAVVCLRWAQDAILTASAATEESGPPQAALPVREAAHPPSQGVGGLSSVVPVFSALQMLCGLGKSGALRVQSGEASFEVLLERGNVVYAHGSRPAPGERLGEILVELGVLTQAELDTAAERARSEGEKIGSLLLRDGLVNPQQLSRALAEQACAVFSRLHASGDARWEFEERAPEGDTEGARLDPTAIMLRGVQVAAEQRHAGPHSTT